MPNVVDVAYELKCNVWRGERRLQLELRAIREHTDRVKLCFGTQSYIANRKLSGDSSESTMFSVTNPDGDCLEAEIDSRQMLLCRDRRATHSGVQTLLEEASLALGLRT